MCRSLAAKRPCGKQAGGRGRAGWREGRWTIKFATRACGVRVAPSGQSDNMQSLSLSLIHI
eukprot:765094-Alexandrium_andersonii.AAC.1